MSRLEFAPDTDEMEVSDISIGRFVFPPRDGETVSLATLRRTIEDAGYAVEAAWIRVTGILDEGGVLVAPITGQEFALAGDRLEDLRSRVSAGDRVTVSGAWEIRDDAETILVEEWTPPESDGDGS